MHSQLRDMLETIRAEAKYTASLTGRAEFSQRVMQALQDVDRGAFVSSGYKAVAYDNGPLPIGHGQTISQPYIVALMTDLLDIAPGSNVLEIGTGSGYQAAVLSRLAGQVYSVERISALAESASERLQRMGYHNVAIRCADGYNGWHEKAPFDAIIVTAAAAHIPPALVKQLKPGGRMLIPVGEPYMDQELILVSRDKHGKITEKSILGVVFVPLVVDEDEID